MGQLLVAGQDDYGPDALVREPRDPLVNGGPCLARIAVAASAEQRMGSERALRDGEDTRHRPGEHRRALRLMQRFQHGLSDRVEGWASRRMTP